MNRLRAEFITALSLFVPSSVALTETIILKNGTVLKGSIIQMTENDVTIDTADLGQMVIKRRAVQSINDGVVTTEPATTQNLANGGAANPPMVNINNNNNNNNNNANNQASTAAAPEAPVKATEKSSTEMAVAASPVDSTRLGGLLAFGVGRVGTGNLLKSDDLPALHWEPIGYQFANGLSLDLIGDVMYQNKKDNSVKFTHTGVAIGVGSRMPAQGQSGGVFTAKLSAGVASFESKSVKVDEDYYYPTEGQVPTTESAGGIPSQNSAFSGYDDYSGESQTTINGSGAAYGLHLGYAYYSSGGAGIQVGASGLQSTMKVKSRGPSAYDKYFDTYEERNQTVLAMEAYAGLAYRF